jgi:TonB family protein
MPIRLNLTDPPAERSPEPETSDRRNGVAVETLPSEETGESPAEGRSPTGNGSGRLSGFRRSRYEELDPTDLLHIIDELEGNRGWASLREKLWIALIIHMLVAWYLLYGPKYIYHVRVVDPSVVMKQRQKELTYLDLPPDVQKPVKPKTQAPLSDKDRVAETPKPTLDRKTLEELEAMKRAAPPAPAPQPSQQPAAPAAPAAPAQQQPQVAEQHPPTPPAQPLPQNNAAKLEAPPMAPQPNFRSNNAGNPNEQLQQAMRQAMQGHGEVAGGDDGANAPSQHPGINGGVDVLSDTMGWDYGPYVQRVIWDTEHAWWPIIPESARPPLNKQGKVMIRFKIYPDGSVHDMILEGPSGDVALDRAAWAGITGGSPFPPIPKAFKGPFLELRFYFLYNIRPGDE